MIFHNVKQGTDAWLNLRLGLVTASRMKDVLAYSKRSVKSKETGESHYPELKARSDYRREIVTERLIGNLAKKDTYTTKEMLWGITNEPLARTEYCFKTNNRVTEEGFCQHDVLKVGVSTDGLVNNEGNLEIKCLSTHNHLYEIVRHNRLPEAYRDQVQTQLWITERQWCDFVGYDRRLPSGLDLFIVRVERDEERIKYIKEETIKFLEETDRDFEYFTQFLPLAEYICLDCGVIFESKIRFCTDCFSSHTERTKVITPADKKLGLKFAYVG